jgi:hypothetical protein
MAPTLRRAPVRPTVETVHLAAPLGGINTVDGGSAMPPTDCVSLWNLIAAEYGLRSRLGYEEWCTGLTGAVDSVVRTVMPLSGGTQSGSADRLFACTSSGIWDCSASSASPSRLVTFATQTGRAGYGVSCVTSTAAGRFLLYADEANGYFVWSESSASWTQVTSTATSNWAAAHAYVLGDRVLNDSGKTYRCTVAGTSDGAGGPTGTGSAIADNTVTWAYVQAVVGGVDPANLCFVTVWKSRVWLVEKDSSRAWYGGVNSLFGTFTSFDFGVRMRAGGPLVGLYNWSYDGGSGLDTLLVGISTAGDVVIYQGTDPSDASAFGLKGVWSVGGVPSGRRIATDYGGDILVMSLLGVIPLSKLVIGNPTVDRSQYATAKVANLFAKQAAAAKSLNGWGVYIHPTDNALLLAIPSAAGAPTGQLVMSFSTRGWSRYRDLPLFSAGVWNGQLYFGTVDGRVCLNAGYVDGVSLADPNAYAPVKWSLLTAFSNMGNARFKRVAMLSPLLRSETAQPSVQAAPRFDFDFSDLPPAAATASATKGTWDNAVWDVDVWGGDATPESTLGGATGLGRHVAVAMAGSAVAETTVVGVDVYLDMGGTL